MSKKLFKDSLNIICGEANQAANLSEQIFQGNDLKEVRRELARIISTIDMKILAKLDNSNE